jgi:hypothetical protein
MLSAFVKIAETIHKAIPAIQSIDLNKGQLDPGKATEFESLSTPAILIGNPDINWAALSQGHEQGEGEVSVCLVVRLPSRTSLIDPMLFESLKQLELADEVNASVKSVPGITSRVSSHEYATGTFYVVEQVYDGFFKSTPPAPITKQVSVTIKPFINRPHPAQA